MDARRRGRKPATFAPLATADAKFAPVESARVLSLRAVARRLAGVSLGFVRELVRTGKLRAVWLGRKQGVPEQELRRFVRELIEAQSADTKRSA